jgi:hypothetical protein
MSWVTRWFTNKVRPVRRPVRKKVDHGGFRPQVEALAERVLPAVTATFSAADGMLTVLGDALDNTIVVSRDAAGTILVNGGAVAIQGGPATVANTRLIFLNGGAGNDTLSLSEANGALPAASISGGDGNDVLVGGSGNDLINGGRGNDTAFLGAGDDTFVWNPGDGSDTVEGGAGRDALLFNGANLSENIDISANGNRVRFTRDVLNITMDLDGVERIDFAARGGADTIVVNDVSGTDLTQVNLDLAGIPGSGTGDGQADTVIVNGTNGNDHINVAGLGVGAPVVNVVGLSAQVNITGSDGPGDSLVIKALGGNDTVDVSGLPANRIGLTVDLGDGQPAATTTALRTSTATAVFGQAEVLTATVNSAAGTPTGTVIFRDGNTVLGTAPVNAAGQATLTVSLGVGSHALTAAFAGSDDFAGSTSAAAAVTVSRAATAVALASSVNPAVTGRVVTFTAAVAAVAPGAGTPTGTVSFLVGNRVVARVRLNAAGRARFMRRFAARGRFVLRAVYSGDGNFAGSAQSITERVRP